MELQLLATSETGVKTANQAVGWRYSVSLLHTEPHLLVWNNGLDSGLHKWNLTEQRIVRLSELW